MSVMLAKLEESFRSLVNKTSDRSTVNERRAPVVKKRSLENYEDAPAAKRPRLLTQETSVYGENKSSFSKWLNFGKEKLSSFKSWVMKNVRSPPERVTVEPVRRISKPQYYQLPSPILGGNFSGPYPTSSRPSVNPGFSDYRPPNMSAMNPGAGHGDSLNMGRGAIPKGTPQTSWNKSTTSVKVPQRNQFVKNSTGIPFIQSGYLHTPYRPVQEKMFLPNTSANRSMSNHIGRGAPSGAKESSRLAERKRYQDLLQAYTNVPLGPAVPSAVPNDRSPVFNSFSTKSKDARREKRPVVVDLCNTTSNDSLAADKLSFIEPMNLQTWERRFSSTSLKQYSSSPFVQSHRKEETPVVQVSRREIETPVLRLNSHEIGAKSPAVAEFEKTVKESKCMTNWIEDLAESRSNDSLRKERAIQEAQLQLKQCEEQKDQWEQDMVRRIKTRLKLASQEPGVYEDEYEEEEEEEEADEFPELGSDAEMKIDAALRPGPPGEKLSEGFRLQISRSDMATLAGLNWLNDEIINFYMEMIKERGESEDRPKIHAFNTFFYPKIKDSGQQSVRRWTKRVNIFEKDYLLIPVHLGMHWCLCVVDFKEKAVKFYDSMKGPGHEILKTVRQYLIDEKKDKQSQVLDLSDWSFITMKDIPPQLNGSDCGVFTCKFADYISLNKKISFTQDNMSYFRRRMVYEILTKKLLLS